MSVNSSALFLFKGGTYSGEARENAYIPNGWGTWKEHGGQNFYKGLFIEGVFQVGLGRMELPNLKLYVGRFERGLPHGPGQLLDVWGKILFEGQMHYGKCELGLAHSLPVRGRFFTGTLEEGQPAGIGRFCDARGVVVESGEFKNGSLQEGFAIKEESWNGKRCWYQGSFKGGQWDGPGQVFSESGEILFAGSFKAGKRHTGFGKEWYDYEGEKVVYEGSFKDGKREGLGQFKNGDGQILFEGTFRNDMAISGEGTVHLNDGIKFVGRIDQGLLSSNGRFYTKEGLLVSRTPHGR